MESTIFIGYIAAALTTIAFIPQVIRVILTKSTKDISRNMYILLTIGIICWIIYGYLKRDIPVLIANSITLCLSLIVLYHKILERE